MAIALPSWTTSFIRNIGGENVSYWRKVLKLPDQFFRFWSLFLSVWITQFIKAMRDEEGKMIKNAHIIGTVKVSRRLVV